MRIAIVLAMMWAVLLGSEAVQVEEKYKDSTKCVACHSHLVAQWKTSWHFKSHYDSDEYFRKSLDYVGRKSRLSENAIQVQCAACHNPRIAVTETGLDYEIMVAMKLDKGSRVNKALDSDVLDEGINCIVCHNIDKIHDDLPEDKRGTHRVTWLPAGIMSGPYEDANSPYHKVEHRTFMNENPNKLCFVCHANDRALNGLVFVNMEQEFGNSKKKCVDCHMGKKVEGIAATLRNREGEQRKRLIRPHGFEGAHTASMWEGALDLKLKRNGNELLVTLINPHPHNLPSGFGARELIIEVAYKNSGKVLERQQMSLTQHYTSRRGKPTIPHLAVEATPEMSIPANGERTFSFAMAEGTQMVSIELYYRLVNDEVRNLLELEEPVWSEKMLISRINEKL